MKNTSKPSNKLILHPDIMPVMQLLYWLFYKAKVLLGSATPSIETYFNGKSGKYGLVEIKERYGNVMMPDIKLVDLKDKYFEKKMKGHFSDTLIEEITP
jgi:primosomal protein N' (replication factor Y)